MAAPDAPSELASPAETFPTSTEHALALLGREQDRALEMLLSQAQAYRVALESAPQGVCIFDAAGLVIYHNARFAQMYLLSTTEDLTGATHAELVDRLIAAGSAAEAPQPWLAQARRVVARRAAETSEMALRDGRRIQVSDHPTPGRRLGVDP